METQLTLAQMDTLVNALRVARERFKEDVRSVDGMPRLQDQFRQQAADTQDLLELIEDQQVTVRE